jgi:hypothetical protein
VRRDPTESANLLSDEPETADRLQRALMEWWKPTRTETYTEREAVAVENMLRDLGYLD